MADAKMLDPVLLKTLAGQGIAAGNVELRRGYAPRSRGKGYSPYARHYRDVASGKNFAVVSALPGCDAYGQSHEIGWSAKGGVIENGNNIFHCKISANSFQLSTLSAQPGGAKKDDEVTFHPQMFINGTKVLPLSDVPELPETDPVNENYHNNVLEWDYGVCLRRVRLIEGRFLGSWVFRVNPGGDVLIRYNQAGKMKLRLQYAKGNDTEFIPKSFFDRARAYPVTISDSATFHPDADPETSCVDGSVGYDTENADWPALVGAAGSNSNDSSNYMLNYLESGTAADKWNVLRRLIVLFDTGSLPDGSGISSATISLYAFDCADNLNIVPNINVYSSDPAYNTALEPGDYDSLGSAALCDTPVTYTGWSAGGYKDFPLNAAGLAAINKTGVTRFGFRNAQYDAGSTPPAWAPQAGSGLYARTAEHGTGYQPALVVVYSTGVTEKSASETGSGAETKTAGHPIVVTGSIETGAGLESLGSRCLGKTETGSGAESLGSRSLGKSEAGLGLDIASLLAAIRGDETGTAAEAALRAVALFSGDGGLGSEIIQMLKNALAGDEGSGNDALKNLRKTSDSSSDIRLNSRTGQTGMPSKQFKTPFKGVNL